MCKLHLATILKFSHQFISKVNSKVCLNWSYSTFATLHECEYRVIIIIIIIIIISSLSSHNSATTHCSHSTVVSVLSTAEIFSRSRRFECMATQTKYSSVDFSSCYGWSQMWTSSSMNIYEFLRILKIVKIHEFSRILWLQVTIILELWFEDSSFMSGRHRSRSESLSNRSDRYGLISWMIYAVRQKHAPFLFLQ